MQLDNHSGHVLRHKFFSPMIGAILATAGMAIIWLSGFLAMVLVIKPQLEYNVPMLAIYLGMPFLSIEASLIVYVLGSAVVDMLLLRFGFINDDLYQSVQRVRFRPFVIFAAFGVLAGGILWTGLLSEDILGFLDICFVSVIIGGIVIILWSSIHGAIRLLLGGKDISTTGIIVSVSSGIVFLCVATAIGWWVYGFHVYFEWWLCPPPS